MNNLWAQSGWTAAPQTASWLAMGLLFLAVFFATLAIGGLIRASAWSRLRLNRTASAATASAAVSLRHDANQSALARMLKNFEKYLLPADSKDQGSVRRKLITAGFMNPAAVGQFYATCAASAVLTPIFLLLVAPLFTSATDGQGKMLWVMAGLAVGYILPHLWLDSRIKERQQAMREGFPDTLDMLVVCVGAGLGLDAAISRVATQIVRAQPILARELNFVALELRAGKSRADALENFAARTGVPEIANFVTLLIQSDALGASVSQTLRVQAEEMRGTRMSRAEELAHALPVKLSMPLVLCILPAMFAAVLGPAIVSIIRDLLPMFAN
jgi:tight adherence protein C